MFRLFMYGDRLTAQPEKSVSVSEEKVSKVLIIAVLPNQILFNVCTYLCTMLRTQHDFIMFLFLKKRIALMLRNG